MSSGGRDGRAALSFDAPADRAGNLALYNRADAQLAPGLVATIAAFLHAAA